MALTKVSRGLLSTSIVDNGNATAITIDANENVLVGTTTHRNFSGGTTEITVGTATTGATAGGAITFDSGSGFLGYLGFQESEGTLGTLTSTPLVFNTGNTERMRIDASGNLLVGTTDSSGDTANDNPVVAGNFTTKYGVTSIASTGTWTTVHTFGSNQGNFMVSMRASGTGNTDHNSVSLVAINTTNTISTPLLAGSSVQIRIVGLSLQVLQNVFAGANINWSIMSIGN